ncbi:hypothetical protein [Streptomyces sp. NPDC001678]|uniref:hypothetical protein n=1 Tax=Streptomyces sp. NPDC001678 TaxID=3364599 RepID=UPI0036831FAE
MQSFTDLTGLDDPAERDGTEGTDGGSGRDGGPAARDSLPLMAGVAAAIAGVGGALALADVTSPLRAPFALFFLIVAPACAVAAPLRGLDPLSRAVVATGGAVAVDLLVAQTMLALHTWTVRGGVVAVAAVSAALLLLAFLLAHARRHRGRATRSRAS